MTPPLTKPPKKNPVPRTRRPTVPPSVRSRVALGLTAAAAEGRFALQKCDRCGHIQYPAQEMCQNCLSVSIRWTAVSPRGRLLSDTTLHHSNELFFRERLPWRLGLVQLDIGPTIIAHVHEDCRSNSAVRLTTKLDRSGQAVMIALPENDTPHMGEERKYREFVCDPKFRRALVTDGKSAVGQALVHALVEAGASIVFVGVAEPWKRAPGFQSIASLPQVQLMPLDVTDTDSLLEVAGEIGPKVDILINSADYNRTSGVVAKRDVNTARDEIEVNYLGLVRLAQIFGPIMRARGADGQNSACAWVNLLSIYALTNFPTFGSWAASKAAAYSASQCLRAEMRNAGIRVVNVFPGPLDDEWHQLILPPKLTPEAVAAAVIAALKEGTEDVFPGAVAQDFIARWRECPKTLERELAAER